MRVVGMYVCSRLVCSCSRSRPRYGYTRARRLPTYTIAIANDTFPHGLGGTVSTRDEEGYWSIYPAQTEPQDLRLGIRYRAIDFFQRTTPARLLWS